MSDARKKDRNWTIRTNLDGTTPSDDAHLAVLMDIRDELKLLNQRMYCWEVTEIPRTLKRIARNTSKPRKRKK